MTTNIFPKMFYQETDSALKKIVAKLMYKNVGKVLLNHI